MLWENRRKAYENQVEIRIKSNNIFVQGYVQNLPGTFPLDSLSHLSPELHSISAKHGVYTPDPRGHVWESGR